jgi:hypothetical protein
MSKDSFQEQIDLFISRNIVDNHGSWTADSGFRGLFLDIYEQRNLAFQIIATELDLTLLPKEEIKPGDLYLAGRNTGPHLLTCNFVKTGCVFPKESAYPYDIRECVKVVENTPTPPHSKNRE